MKDHIELDAEEARLCSLLVACSDQLRSERSINVTCRIAGGWVRDKLLGNKCKDMDIAVDSMTGFQFASYLHEYVHDVIKNPDIFHHHNSQDDPSSRTSSGVAKIKVNPEKSKHLETATAKIYGLDLDFVNLRHESYQDGSRIPNEMSIGTPLEDAQRRDLTINSLFYNLHSGLVEDYLGCGLEDLRNGIIRTPLDPYVTFKDDPLRVLRAIRFASRFNYRIVDDIPRAARSPEIQKCLMEMVSRERVGIEVKKMLMHSNAHHALNYIVNFGIYEIVFSTQGLEMQKYDAKTSDVDPSTGVEAMNLVREKLNESGLLVADHITSDLDNRFAVNFAAALYPLHNYFYAEGKRKTPRSVSYHIIKESLKLSNNEAESVSRLQEFSRSVRYFMDRIDSVSDGSVDSEAVMDFRRDLGVFLQSFIKALPKHTMLHNDVLISHAALMDVMQNQNASVEPYLKLKQMIHRLDLTGCHLKQTVFNGTQIVEQARLLLGKDVMVGNWVGGVLSDIMKMQLKYDQVETHDIVLTKAREIIKSHLQDQIKL